MTDKTFCVGVYNEGILLSIVEKNKTVIKKYIEDMFISDGVLLDQNAAVCVIKEFLNENKLKPKLVKFFIKSSKIMTRLTELPLLNKDDLKSLLKQNVQDFFPVSVSGYLTGSAVVYSDIEDEKVMLFAAAVPSEIIAAYCDLFAILQIELKQVNVFSELVMSMLMNSDIKEENHDFIKHDMIVVLENNNKSNIIFYKCGKPLAIRNLPYLINSFERDMDNIIKMYDIDVGEFYFFGERYKLHHSYFFERGAVFDIEKSLDNVIIKFNEGSFINLLPPPYKNKIKTKKAIKVSTACIAVIFLLTILMVITIEYTISFINLRIKEYTQEIENELFIESDAAAYTLEELLEVSKNIEQDFKPFIAHDILYDIFLHIPEDLQINTVTIESKTRNVTISGTTKNDDSLIILNTYILNSGAFSNAEITEVKYEGSLLIFDLTFSYR